MKRALLICLLASAAHVSAGSQADPELSDPLGDSQSALEVDVIAAWIEESAGSHRVFMEFAALEPTMAFTADFTWDVLDPFTDGLTDRRGIRFSYNPLLAQWAPLQFEGGWEAGQSRQADVEGTQISALDPLVLLPAGALFANFEVVVTDVAGALADDGVSDKDYLRTTALAGNLNGWQFANVSQRNQFTDPDDVLGADLLGGGYELGDDNITLWVQLDQLGLVHVWQCDWSIWMYVADGRSSFGALLSMEGQPGGLTRVYLGGRDASDNAYNGNLTIDPESNTIRITAEQVSVPKQATYQSFRATCSEDVDEYQPASAPLLDVSLPSGGLFLYVVLAIFIIGTARILFKRRN